MITTINEFKKINENIENPVDLKQVGRLSKEILALLNAQILNELQSFQIYQGMTCWTDDKGWIGASKYYAKTSQEELTHMTKIYNYIFSRNNLAHVPVTTEVKQQFSSIKEVLEDSLSHEMLVTSQWENISQKAKEIGDNTTYQFAQWFLNEQIDEETKFRDILFKLDLDMPNWKLDELFETL